MDCCYNTDPKLLNKSVNEDQDIQQTGTPWNTPVDCQDHGLRLHGTRLWIATVLYYTILGYTVYYYIALYINMLILPLYTS